MSDNSQGSQSRAVVLVASLFLLTLSVVSAFILYTGPDSESVFVIFRKWFLFYPLMLCAVLLFGRFAVMGFKKFIGMPKQ